MLRRLTAYVAPRLRRTKEEVRSDLPDKIVDIVRVDLGEEHRHIYDQFTWHASAPGFSICYATMDAKTE